MRHEHCKSRFGIYLLILISFGLLSAPVMAQEAEGGEEEAFEANVIEVFLGGTFHDGDGNASYGLSYERRLMESFGIGGLVEYTDGREWVYAVPLTFHVTEAWKLVLAPGFEHEEGENTYLTRIGTAYEFKFDGWSLAPEINVDMVDGEAKTVAGVSIGFEF